MMRRRQRSDEPRWRFIVDGPSPYNPSVRPGGKKDFQWGRTWTLQRDDGERALVEVEANAAALEAYVDGTISKAGRVAIQTEGRSAVEAHLTEDDLPDRIHITKTGVRRLH